MGFLKRWFGSTTEGNVVKRIEKADKRCIRLCKKYLHYKGSGQEAYWSEELYKVEEQLKALMRLHKQLMKRDAQITHGFTDKLRKFTP